MGEILLNAGEEDAAKAKLEAIPDEDYLHPVAMMTLADYAEANHRPAEALAYIERARAADPRIYITPSRLDKLEQRATEGDAETRPISKVEHEE
jgi:hypothetical protein